MNNDFCYFCGAAMVTREHVPPENLFPDHMKTDMKTVPSCHKHNRDFGKLDERMQYNIAFMSNSQIALDLVDVKLIPALEDPIRRGLAKKVLTGYVPLPRGKGAARKFKDNEDYRTYFEKIAMGAHFLEKDTHYKGTGTPYVCFRQYLQHAPNVENEFRIIMPLFDKVGRLGTFSHSELFEYKWVEIPEGAGYLFYVLMRFYRSIEVIVTLKPSDIITT